MAHILITEDVPEVLFAYQEILKDAGHTCCVAENGAEAKKYLNEDHFDLIVTDMLMPEMDGIQLATYAHRMVKRPKLLVVTGGGDRISANEAIRMGEHFFDAFLVKPVSKSDLINTINHLLGATLQT